MEFPNGATGVFVTSTGDLPGTNRFEITMDKAKIVCDKENLSVFELDMSEREFCYSTPNGFPSAEGKFLAIETDGLNLQHVGVLNAFAGKILHGTSLVADGTEGINGLTLSNAMHLSSWLQRPVTLPIDEDLFLGELNKLRQTSKTKKEVKEVFFSTEGTY